MIDEYRKEAVKLVALDRQLAAACAQALRHWAASRKATARVIRATMFAAALDDALRATKI